MDVNRLFLAIIAQILVIVTLLLMILVISLQKVIKFVRVIFNILTITGFRIANLEKKSIGILNLKINKELVLIINKLTPVLDK